MIWAIILPYYGSLAATLMKYSFEVKKGAPLKSQTSIDSFRDSFIDNGPMISDTWVIIILGATISRMQSWLKKYLIATVLMLNYRCLSWMPLCHI